MEQLVGFRTDPTSWALARFKMLSGTYEKPLMHAIRETFPDTGVFVDIGANVGFVSHTVARTFPRAKILAFEPNPRIYPTLLMNLKRSSNCECFNVGLGSVRGKSEFFHGAESCVSSFVPGFSAQHVGNRSNGRVEQVEVQVERGDSMLSGIGDIDVMKIDVEGYELEVLRGLSNLLETGAIRVLFFEYCPFGQTWGGNQPQDIIQYLTANGYAISEIEGEWAGSIVSEDSAAALTARLGDKGYTMLRASRKCREGEKKHNCLC